MNASFSFCCRVIVSIRRPIRSKKEPYSTFEKCAVIIYDNKKYQKIKVSRKRTVFVDILNYILAMILRDLLNHQALGR